MASEGGDRVDVDLTAGEESGDRNGSVIQEPQSTLRGGLCAQEQQRHNMLMLKQIVLLKKIERKLQLLLSRGDVESATAEEMFDEVRLGSTRFMTTTTATTRSPPTDFMDAYPETQHTADGGFQPTTGQRLWCWCAKDYGGCCLHCPVADDETSADDDEDVDDELHSAAEEDDELHSTVEEDGRMHSATEEDGGEIRQRTSAYERRPSKNCSVGDEDDDFDSVELLSVERF